MTDRVYPSSKTNGTTAATTTTTTTGAAIPPHFPPTKAQLQNPTRHPYRPQQQRPTTANNRRRRRSGRSCACLCCFWSFLIIIVVLLLAAISGAAVYVLYRPRRPTFSVSSLRISQFNLTAAPDDSTHLTTKLNLTVSSKNPNKKNIAFFFDPIDITSTSSNDVVIANGSFPSFISSPNNVTIIHCTLFTRSQVLDAESANALRSDLKRKNGVPLKLVLDTGVKVKMESLKSKRVGIRVTCEGIHGLVPKGNSSTIAATSNAICKVDLRIKIWKWTF